ncbi:MAG: hypothetical protein GX106_05775 [Candidatus Cloacimonetes bacterium]|jgi:hypothetical protein|nr:hypothetical protein [Candidatus Cloacimonadota bacterium]
MTFMTMNMLAVAVEGGYAPWILTIVLAFIAMILVLYYGHLTRAQNREMEGLREQLKELRSQLSHLKELDKLIPGLIKIAHLDHDINTPLCVVTMSLGRAKELAKTNNDESLMTNVEDILEAVRDIGEMMKAVRVLKTSPLIPYNDKVNK